MIKAVIFDLFETLITERIHTPYDRLSVAQRIGVDEQVFRNEWRRIQKDRMTGAFHDYASVLTSICDSLECNIDQSMIRQLENERIARFSMIFINPDPDIIDALKEIRRLDIKTGLVSNASPDEIVAWNGCLVHSFIDASVFSCEVG